MSKLSTTANTLTILVLAPILAISLMLAVRYGYRAQAYNNDVQEYRRLKKACAEAPEFKNFRNQTDWESALKATSVRTNDALTNCYAVRRMEHRKSLAFIKHMV
jgi:hypothetical protein